MFQLLEVAIKCPRTMLHRCIAWLTSTPRNYPGRFLHHEYRYHKSSLGLLLFAYALFWTAFIIHIIPYTTDLATVVAAYVAMVTNALAIGLLSLLIFTRAVQYENAFHLGFALCFGSAFPTLVAWILHCRIYCTSFNLGNLLLGLSPFVSFLSSFIYFCPEITCHCCCGDDDDTDQRPLLRQRPMQQRQLEQQQLQQQQQQQEQQQQRSQQQQLQQQQLQQQQPQQQSLEKEEKSDGEDVEMEKEEEVGEMTWEEDEIREVRM